MLLDRVVKRSHVIVCGAVCAMLALAPAIQAAGAMGSPRDVVVRTANAVAAALEGRRGYFRANPEELFEVIDEILWPNFDVRYAAYKVMGDANWKQATKTQRDRFVETFYQFMLRSYATGLLRLNPDSLTIEPGFQSNDRFAAVQTSIMQDTGDLIPVNYRLRNTKSGWRVYDVRIEGVSYVENYGNQFAAEIDALGLDAVIARLRSEIDRMRREPPSPEPAEPAAGVAGEA